MSIREQALSWLRGRIASLPPPQGAGDWPRQLEISGGVLLVAGDNVCCWFLDPEGELFEADRDSIAPRLERVTDPERRRSVLREAARSIPELSPLLDSPVGSAGQPEVHSVDGRWPPPPPPPPAPTTRYVGELTAEHSLVSMFVFFWLAGLAPLLPAVMLLVASTWAARLQALLWLAGSVTIAVAFVRIAARPRVVDVTADGALRVCWGRRLPLTIRRVALAGIEDVQIAREARFAVQSRGGRAPGMHARPDRWRIRARFAEGRTVDVGTTATEQEAAAVRTRLLAWRASPVELPPRGNRA